MDEGSDSLPAPELDGETGSINSSVTQGKDDLDATNLSDHSVIKGGSPSHDHHIPYPNNHRRATISSYHTDDSPPRNSSETSKSASSIKKAVPHYLRASTGSCHDLCKYGHKHDVGTKERHPFPKRLVKPSMKEQNNHVEAQATVPVLQKKKKIFVKAESSSDGKAYSVELNLSPKQKQIRSGKAYSAKKKGSSGNMINVMKNEPLPARKSPSPDPPEIIKREIGLQILLPIPQEGVELEVSPEQGASTDNKMSRAKKANDSPKKLSPPVQKRAVMKPSSSSDKSGGVNEKGRRNSGNVGNGEKMMTQNASSSNRKNDVGRGKKVMTSSKTSGEKALANPAASLSPKISLMRKMSLKTRKTQSPKKLSSLKDQNKTKRERPNDDDKVPEKTLGVVGPVTKKKVSESVPNSNVVSSVSYSSSSNSSVNARSVSQSTNQEEEIESSDKGVEVTSGKTKAADSNKATRKIKVVGSEGKDDAALKLKFRRGKVVDLKSENNSPRKLRFRKARVLGEDQDGKGYSRRRTWNKGGMDEDKNGRDLTSHKIVLKHQHVQGKKDAQGLFNNVIEETASKLVETRKSKVKALVGAFETVISLQETKPSTNVAA